MKTAEEITVNNDWGKVSLIINYSVCIYRDARGGVVGGGAALQDERLCFRLLAVSLGFFTVLILPAALWPWG